MVKGVCIFVSDEKEILVNRSGMSDTFIDDVKMVATEILVYPDRLEVHYGKYYEIYVGYKYVVWGEV